MLPALFTKRTVLLPLSLEDAARVQVIFPNWEVVKYLNALVPWPYPPDGAESYIRGALPKIEAGSEHHWTIRLASDSGVVIGSAGLIESEEHNRGFWLGEPWQRQGLMSEVADAITDYWFDALGRDVLRVYKAIENSGSRRISEKSGMRVIDRFERDFVCGRLPAEQWEVTAEEWRRYRTASRRNEMN
jgi:[ribosomal protein S5]-alanine N-acetyltransferase